MIKIIFFILKKFDTIVIEKKVLYMFFIFLIFHLVVFLESYLLIKKKLRQKGMVLTLANIIIMLINLIVLFKSVGNYYSSLLYMKDIALNHPILTMIWILINIALFALIFFVIQIATRKEKQTKVLKNGLYIGIGFMSLIFLIVLFQNAFPWVLLAIAIFAVYKLTRSFLKDKRSTSIALAILITILSVYSFGTYIGAARLQIFLAGYPFKAYNTGLEELRYYNEENVKKYMPTSEIATSSGEMGMIEVKNYGLIKIGTYIGY